MKCASINIQYLALIILILLILNVRVWCLLVADMNNFHRSGSLTVRHRPLIKWTRSIAAFTLKIRLGRIVLPCSLPWRQLRISCAPPRIFSVRKHSSVGQSAMNTSHCPLSLIFSASTTVFSLLFAQLFEVYTDLLPLYCLPKYSFSGFFLMINVFRERTETVSITLFVFWFEL